MSSVWRIALTFAAAALVLVATAVVVEHLEAVDPSATSYGWGSDLDLNRPLQPNDMVLIPAGKYVIGDNSTRYVRLDTFYIDRHEVTNHEFARFVESTGYVTTVVQKGGGWIYRGGERNWKYVPGASWRHPLGPGSSIESAMNHPVVLVSWYDAIAYAQWAGKRLPTEAEWEVAARMGAASNSKNPAEDGSANVWQGYWPQKNELTDGFFYTAPVGSFTPDSLGLYDMIGNVWEWTSDWYAPDTYRVEELVYNPVGPKNGGKRVARGGSWFCSSNYCSAYRPGFRGKSPPSYAFNNVGFRCARNGTSQPE